MNYLAIVFLTVLSTNVFADNCDKPRDDFDGLYCLNKVYQESDKELNVVYKELRSYLSKSERNSLKKTQITGLKIGMKHVV